MPQDLDAAWREAHPEPTPDNLKLRWAGLDLVRLEEVPMKAWRMYVASVDPDVVGMDEMVAAVAEALHPDSRDAFREQADAMSVARVKQLWDALIEAGTSRPTGPASDSGSGRSTNGTASTEGSPPTSDSTSDSSASDDSSTSPTPSAGMLL